MTQFVQSLYHVFAITLCNGIWHAVYPKNHRYGFHSVGFCCGYTHQTISMKTYHSWRTGKLTENTLNQRTQSIILQRNYGNVFFGIVTRSFFVEECGEKIALTNKCQMNVFLYNTYLKTQLNTCSIHYVLTHGQRCVGSGNGLLPDGTKPLPEPMLVQKVWHKMC